MSKRQWRDGGRDRGAEERNADLRRRRGQERRRADVDRAARSESVEDAEFVLGDGPTLRRLPEPSELGGVLQQFVEARGWGERLRGADLESNWEAIVGEQLAPRTRPGRLVNGVLQVVVASPQWATQVQYMTEQLAGRVSAETGMVVDRVVVVVGDVSRTDPDD